MAPSRPDTLAGGCYRGLRADAPGGVAMAIREVAAAEAAPAHRIPLPFLLAPFAVAAGASTVADWTWPSMVTDHPLLLITLSSKNRFLLLTAPQLGIVAFFVVGFLRLVVTDPLTYLLDRE